MNLTINRQLKEKLNEGQKKHIEKMIDTLDSLSEKELIFKGGSSLLFKYNLDRFSEDLDFDAMYKINITSLINSIKKTPGLLQINIKKNTDTTKRLILLFDNNVSLKIEISLRNKEPDKRSYNSFSDKMKVYTINSLFEMKLNALMNRTTARDIYDIAFILDKHFSKLNKNNLDKSSFLFKDIMETAIDYEQVFKQDRILDEEDLWTTALRLERAKKKLLEINHNKQHNKNNVGEV